MVLANEDLSQLGYPITGRLPYPRTLEAWRAFELSEEELAFFEENGYLAGRKVLDSDYLQRLRDEFEAFQGVEFTGQDRFHEYHRNESSETGRVLFHALGAWRVGPAFHDLLWHPAWTVPASQLLRGAVRFWHDQVFGKPARDGGIVSWHQDYSYWTRTRPLNHLTVWIALDDATIENGCVQYVPGSHRWPLLPKPVLAGGLEGLDAIFAAAGQPPVPPVPAPVRAGEALFHHPLMLHGSDCNRSDFPRRAAVINAIRDGVKSDSDEPLLQGIPVIPKGHALREPFFPLLLDPHVIGLAHG